MNDFFQPPLWAYAIPVCIPVHRFVGYKRGLQLTAWKLNGSMDETWGWRTRLRGGYRREWFGLVAKKKILKRFYDINISAYWYLKMIGTNLLGGFFRIFIRIPILTKVFGENKWNLVFIFNISVLHFKWIYMGPFTGDLPPKFLFAFIFFSRSLLKNIWYVFFYSNMICIISEKSIFENYWVQKSDCLNCFVTAKVFDGKIWKFHLICAWYWTLK